MRSIDLPFNVELLKLTPDKTQTLRPVTSIDYFDASSGDLDDNGLFSIPIFGRVGSEERDQRFSYVNIKLHLFHPVIYERLSKLKALYNGILTNKQHAVWDKEKEDFVASDEVNGETGFTFFLKYWKRIKFVRNDSGIRDMRIQLIEKYKDRATTDKILILPAGLRDIETGEDGRTTTADINAVYRKLVSIASTIPEFEGVNEDSTQDLARTMLQTTFNELYKLLEQMVTGKKGFFQSRWASRAVFNGTRNVMTAADLSAEFLGAPNSPKYNDTVYGLHQASRMLLPKTVFQLRNTYLPEVFSHGDNRAFLVDPKTLKGEVTEIAPDTYDRWITSDGLEKIVASYGEVSMRAKPVMVDGRYLALIYRGPDMTFRVFNDIDDLPSHLNKKDVYPITLVELIYLSGLKIWGQHIAMNTRYPITGIGSCYPSYMYVKTTIRGEVRRELGPDWEPLEGDDHRALEYPVFPIVSYLDSMVVATQRIGGLGAD